MARADLPVRLWGPVVVRQFVREVRDRYGNGWALLSPEQQHGAIAVRFAAVLLANDRDGNSIPAAAIATLYHDMIAAAGLE